MKRITAHAGAAAFLVLTALAFTGDRDAIASIDLGTCDGTALVKGQWRYRDIRLVETSFRAAGPGGQPTGDLGKAWDIDPHAGAADFDDSAWEAIAPESLSERRTAGRLAFNWYRIRVTVPDSINGIDPTGSTVMFETSVDDYAEIWADGELTRYAGQSGGSMVAGWNAANRLIVARNVRKGQRISLAVFGANAPLSSPPTNYIFMRHARLSFHRSDPGPVATPPSEVNVEVKRADPALDRIVSYNPKIYKLADGFQFTEGPVWVSEGGYLLFSDPNANTIYKYTPPEGGFGKATPGALTVFRRNSGYSGDDAAAYGQPGSNGLTLDREGRLTINEHGNRRVSRLERNGSLTVLADRFEGRRLNSPNDLVYADDGTLYFTDPPFGLPKFFDDPRKEIPFSGVYSLRNGRIRLESKELAGPNGIALSPDGKSLYVSNWDPKRKVILRHPVREDGSLGSGELFFDMTKEPGEDALDGLKVDRDGNLYSSGPGGLWIISPQGRHLGTVIPPKHPHNMAWGGADGRTLYLCARSGLYAMPLGIPGIRPR